MRRTRIALGAGAVALTACGPTTPLHAGLAGQPQNVLLGRQKQPPTPPPLRPALAAFETVFPVPVTITTEPVPEPSFSFSPKPPACPTAPPFAFPALAAPDTPAGPPNPGGPYPMRYTGTYVTNPGTAGASSNPVPASGTLQVSNVVPAPVIPGDGGYQFTTTEIYNGYRTVTVYQVIPTSKVPAVPVTQSSPPAGLYLVRMTMTPIDPGTSASDFQPTPMILLAPFPAQVNQSVAGQGSDAANSTAMVIQPSSSGTQQSVLNANGTPTPGPPATPLPASPPNGSQEIGHQRVDACGTPLDSWQVELIGHYDSRNKPTLDFDNTYDIATQYGGLIVGYHRHETGVTTNGSSVTPFTYDVTATISVAPH